VLVGKEVCTLCYPFCMDESDKAFPLFVLPFGTSTCYVGIGYSCRMELLKRLLKAC